MYLVARSAYICESNAHDCVGEEPVQARLGLRGDTFFVYNLVMYTDMYSEVVSPTNTPCGHSRETKYSTMMAHNQ